jgi:hypothetical protein
VSARSSSRWLATEPEPAARRRLARGHDTGRVASKLKLNANSHARQICRSALARAASRPRRPDSLASMAVTIYGVCALTFMMAMYALERRGRGFILAFAFGCVLSSAYGFLSGAWPFGVVELVWAAIAVRRYHQPIAA